MTREFVNFFPNGSRIPSPLILYYIVQNLARRRYRLVFYAPFPHPRLRRLTALFISACQTCRFRHRRVHTHCASGDRFFECSFPALSCRRRRHHARLYIISEPTGPLVSGRARARTRYVPRRRTMIRCCVRPTGGRRRVVVAALAFSAYFHYSTPHAAHYFRSGPSSFLSFIIVFIILFFFHVRLSGVRELVVMRRRARACYTF